MIDAPQANVLVERRTSADPEAEPARGEQPTTE